MATISRAPRRLSATDRREPAAAAARPGPASDRRHAGSRPGRCHPAETRSPGNRRSSARESCLCRREEPAGGELPLSTGHTLPGHAALLTCGSRASASPQAMSKRPCRAWVRLGSRSRWPFSASVKALNSRQAVRPSRNSGCRGSRHSCRTPGRLGPGRPARPAPARSGRGPGRRTAQAAGRPGNGALAGRAPPPNGRRRGPRVGAGRARC